MGIPGAVEPDKRELCIESWQGVLDGLTLVDEKLSGHDIIDLSIYLNKKRYGYSASEGKENRGDYEEALQVVTSLFEGMAHIDRDMMLDFIGRQKEIYSHLMPKYGSIVLAIQSDCGTATIDESGCYFVLTFFGEDARRDFGYMDTHKGEFKLLDLIDKAKDCFMHLDDWVAAIAAAVAKLVRKKHEALKKRIQHFVTREVSERWLAHQLKKLKRRIPKESKEFTQILETPSKLGFDRQKGYNPDLEPEEGMEKYQRILAREEVAKRVLFYLTQDMLYCNNPFGRAYMKCFGMNELIPETCEKLSSMRGIISMTGVAAFDGEIGEHFAGIKKYKHLQEIVYATQGGLVGAGLAFGPKERIPMEILLPPRPEGAVDLNVELAA
ncbi:hypothetical protein MK805_04430 [Shimazuella sp. AN120528]|uniref:hypothetical protein n=1 Tax=Shimazuella soli TaxID=1892854 RepID=UPI001F0CE3B4|nr:hypothetical protein [Shimazuella soli]MCH5584213.1 hypothetical protein [Shimazuella soli]